MYSSSSISPGLLKSATHGDAAAFRKVYDSIAGLLFKICLKYFPNRNDAGDVFQDGMIKIYRNLEKFRGEGSFEGWAARIMFTTCIDGLKRKKRDRISFRAELPENSWAIEQAGPGNLNMQDLIRQVQLLPHGYRTTFSLFYLDGLNHKEIAGRLGITVGTSKAQLFHARKYLQRTIRPAN